MPLDAALAAVLSAVLCAPLSAQPAAPSSPDAPFDCTDPPLDAAARAALRKAGDGFADRCAVTAPDGRRLSRREVKAAVSGDAGVVGAPDAPGGKTAKGALSPDVARKLAALSKSVAAGMDAAGLGKAYDGGGGGGSEAGGAGAPSAAARADLAARYGKAEAAAANKFSAAFDARVESVLGASQSGRRTLDRLRGVDGALRLPPVAIVDLGGGSIPAQFDRFSTHPTLELDVHHAAQAALDSLKDASPAERARLTRAWKDPLTLASALEKDPKLLAAVTGRLDGTIVHELTHAWQARRDRSVDLAADGNREPVEWEVEAYREEMRYFHEKVARDPSVLDSAGTDADTYAALLSGYDGFRDRIVSLYQGLADGSFPRLERALAKRRGGAGQAADASALQSEYAARERAFVADDLPALQKEGYALVVARDLETGRPYKALALLAGAPDDIRAQRGAAALEASVAYLKKDPPAGVDERLDAWQAYLAYQVKTTGSNVMPDDLFSLYQRDYRAAYELKAAEAAAARTPKARREALEWAKSYAAFLPSPEKERLLKRLSGAAK